MDRVKLIGEFVFKYLILEDPMILFLLLETEGIWILLVCHLPARNSKAEKLHSCTRFEERRLRE